MVVGTLLGFGGCRFLLAARFSFGFEVGLPTSLPFRLCLGTARYNLFKYKRLRLKKKLSFFFLLDQAGFMCMIRPGTFVCYLDAMVE